MKNITIYQVNSAPHYPVLANVLLRGIKAIFYKNTVRFGNL